MWHNPAARCIPLVQNGVDALGLVFYPPSPRNIDIATAQQIVDSLPPFITAVGLFCNPTAEQVQQVISNVALDCLQFHGDEQPDFVNNSTTNTLKHCMSAATQVN